MILLLAGTAEGRAVAQGLADADIPVLASLAGATRDPRGMPVRTRVGGFGGAEGFLALLREEGVDRVIDATHPFAHRISARTARLCADTGVAYLQLLRAPWVPGPGDTWTEITQEAEAAAHVPPGAVVFLATGRQGLEGFANLAGREVICRQIEATQGAFPFEGGRYLIGRPPFSVADEITLFRDLGVDWLVVKNAGGAASATKLAAARELRLPVLMLARPPQPEAERVETVAEALAWATR